ncbi:MAG TPA: deacetylase [Myxococcaceae bacterium]|nr:deacetylase [Myxococcaceae bacterium]
MAETTRVQPRLWRVYRRLDPGILTSDDPEAELLLDRREGRSGLAFGVYTRAGLEKALRAYGTLERLEARGLGKIDVRLDLSDGFRPRICLVGRAYPDRPCIDVELRETSGVEVGFPPGLGRIPVLYLESLLLQHPGATFDWARPPLPEQERPGLSLSQEVLQLLVLLAKRVGVEALVLRPSTFHAASIYTGYFRFLDGRAQGRLESLRADRALRPLWLLSWALELGCVRRQGERVGFAPDPMAAPLSHRVAGYFARPAWLRARRRGRGERHALDLPCLRARFPWERMPAGDPPASLRARLVPPRGKRTHSGESESADIVTEDRRGM